MIKNQQAHEHLKTLFVKEPVFQQPEPSRPFVVQADASDMVVVAADEWGGGTLTVCLYIMVID